MGYDRFGKGSLFICILYYVRSIVLCVTVGFVTFIFIFRILYLSLLRTYLLRLYYSGGGWLWWWWWGMLIPCAPRVVFLTVHVRAILKQCLNDSDISILRTQIVRSTERMYRKWALYKTSKFADK